MNRIVRLEKDPSHSMNIHLSQELPLKDRIIMAIKTVYDPEIPVNLYDLGLIYDIEISADKEVHINMTLTAPACPVADTLPGQVAAVVRQIEDVNSVKVDLVFDPPWTQDRMTEDAQLLLNLL